MLDIEIVEHKDGRTTKIKGFESEGLIVLPIMGGLIDERVVLLVKTANDFGKPAATTFNEIGILANPGDNPAEILKTWKKINSLRERITSALCKNNHIFLVKGAMIGLKGEILGIIQEGKIQKIKNGMCPTCGEALAVPENATYF